MAGRPSAAAFGCLELSSRAATTARTAGAALAAQLGCVQRHHAVQGGYECPVSDNRAILMPTDVDARVGFFDRFAGQASIIASRAPFFAACVLLIVVWAPTVVFLKFDTWQLLINTATTIVTFLLVALLQNSQTRNDQATQHKLNAIAKGLADLMTYLSEEGDDIRDDIKELRAAVGLEDRESTTTSQAA
jgi:low affinity Fe/Cu permease